MIKFVIRKDVYDYLVEKGYGKKDYGKLQKVQRPDKNGVMRTIYVNPSEEIENEEQMSKQEVEVKEKTNKLKVPDETSSFATDVNRMVKLKKENYKEFAIQLEKLHSKYTISKWKDLYNKIQEKEYAKNTKSKDFTVGQEINFSSQGRDGLNGEVTAIGELGVTVKDANGKIYKVNYDEIKK